MPTYTYQCKKCGTEMDVFHAMSESPRVKCDECGSASVTKLIGSGAGIIFKGSGFYETDYKDKGKGKKSSGKAKDGDDSSEKGKSKSESKSESKPKSDSKSKGGKTGGPDSTKAA